jgi:hypothetical protein
MAQIGALSSDESFGPLEHIFHPVAGRFYSIARCFKVETVVACRELEIPILCPVVDPDQFPCHVIESGSQIVDSIAYYRGESSRQFLDKANADIEPTGCGVGLDTKSVRLLCDKSHKLPLNVGNVMIRALDFLFRTVEHT